MAAPAVDHQKKLSWCFDLLCSWMYTQPYLLSPPSPRFPQSPPIQPLQSRPASARRAVPRHCPPNRPSPQQTRVRRSAGCRGGMRQEEGCRGSGRRAGWPRSSAAPRRPAPPGRVCLFCGSVNQSSQSASLSVSNQHPHPPPQHPNKPHPPPSLPPSLPRKLTWSSDTCTRSPLGRRAPAYGSNRLNPAPRWTQPQSHTQANPSHQAKQRKQEQAKTTDVFRLQLGSFFACASAALRSLSLSPRRRQTLTRNSQFCVVFVFCPLPAPRPVPGALPKIVTLLLPQTQKSVIAIDVCPLYTGGPTVAFLSMVACLLQTHYYIYMENET